jgi:hypothetical protein
MGAAPHNPSKFEALERGEVEDRALAWLETPGGRRESYRGLEENMLLNQYRVSGGSRALPYPQLQRLGRGEARRAHTTLPAFRPDKRRG